MYDLHDQNVTIYVVYLRNKYFLISCLLFRECVILLLYYIVYILYIIIYYIVVLGLIKISVLINDEILSEMVTAQNHDTLINL